MSTAPTGEQPRVTTALDGDVWRVTLDSPETGNALDRSLIGQLSAALAARPADARAVLLLGNGPRFCVGGDVNAFAAADDDLPALVGELAAAWHEVIKSLLYCPVPVVAGVHGAVAGAGMGLLGACDIVVCARRTKLRPAYGGLGLSPDGGTSWALTRALGAPRALEVLLTDGTLTAADAHLLGLVARLVDDESLP
jgi:2-(1,2-epoxy-1,2-dihydrophenyl)acetyl-CoA isomerase